MICLHIIVLSSGRVVRTRSEDYPENRTERTEKMKINREKIPGGIPEDFRPEAELRKIESLQELAEGQESGILIYDENVLVCNWAGQKGLPRVTFSYDVALTDSSAVELTEVMQLSDIRTVLPGTVEYDDETDTLKTVGMKVLHDEVNDIDALFGYSSAYGARAKLNRDGSIRPTAGVCYRLESGGETVLVVVPEDWG